MGGWEGISAGTSEKATTYLGTVQNQGWFMAVGIPSPNLHVVRTMSARVGIQTKLRSVGDPDHQGAIPGFNNARAENRA